MSQRREIENRLELYEDLTGILGAMRSFALAELHKVTKREATQQQLVEQLRGALDDVAFALPKPPPVQQDIWLLFGSVRGFCGSFNEDVVRFWQANGASGASAIVIGERLFSAMQKSDGIAFISGANGSLDAAATIERMLPAIADVRRRCRGMAGLIACFRNEHGACSQRLLPLAGECADQGAQPPDLFFPPEETAAGIAEHYLFHQLLAILLRAIRVENHLRLMQMENALNHLEEGSDELIRQRNRLRQEEIVEEIELMIGGKTGTL